MTTDTAYNALVAAIRAEMLTEVQEVLDTWKSSLNPDEYADSYFDGLDDALITILDHVTA
jgi:non-homologous end joining protein Ku